MRILRTGHEIADTVASAIPDMDGDAVIGYGILRGNAEIFKQSKIYFELDRGYFHPGHYDGYYRISCNGTQQTYDWPEPDYGRFAALKAQLQPWRGFDHSKPVLVCPPTEAVRAFFSYTGMAFETSYRDKNFHVRKKGDTSPINFGAYNYVLTFNSSVGWQALAAGIPCVSDTIHSIVGSWFKNELIDTTGKNSLAKLSQSQYIDREKLFATMAASQFTLAEIREGKAWNLLEHFMAKANVGKTSV